MFSAVTEKSQEERAALKVEQKQGVENNRKPRIFDPKIRTIGQDVQALEAQIAEKKRIADWEKERERLYDAYMVKMSRDLMRGEGEAERTKRQFEKEVLQYRMNEQQASQRREYDLNDPNSLRNSEPIRDGDDDPRLGVSSLQKFQGEDVEYARRLKEQQDIQREWILQQIEEQRQARIQEANEGSDFSQKTLATANRMMNAEAEFRQHLRDLQAETRDYNLDLARAKKQKEYEEKLKDLEASKEEINKTVNGSILNENLTATTKSMLGDHRKVPYAYKGLSPEEKQRVLEEQYQQALENEAKKTMGKDEEKHFDLVNAAIRRNMLMQERDAERKRKDMKRELAETLKRQAQEKAERDNYLNKVVYTNKPDDSYFGQFGTTTR
eukprot:CAMPEP_0113868758 /NCGR_PEP_ID=MMETSP0780_2-20120614/1167_1 /TAXON_ID=652834 /ORGANISM="Palpitomonas bilix" /LENGTH=382 /DNA_ID=CAMNT_0000853877 /DNA_START=130 /DNA_END=1278 /DNA_ORIENTATION=- /assembly_acc=CAM_ASM_000599